MSQQENLVCSLFKGVRNSPLLVYILATNSQCIIKPNCIFRKRLPLKKYVANLTSRNARPLFNLERNISPRLYVSQKMIKV